MRIVNFRTFLYSAVSVLIGVFVCALFCINKIAGAILISCLIAANCILLIFYRKKIKYVVAFSVSAVCLIVMITLTAIAVTDRHAEINYEEQHSVSGIVESIEYEAGECDIVLKHTEIDGISASGRIKVYVTIGSADPLEFLREGYTFKFTSNIGKTEILKDDFVNTYSLESDVRYVAYTDSASVEFTPERSSFLVRVRRKLKDMLTDRMGNKYGTIAYGMLTGERDGLDTATESYFGLAGIGHILAVSGLHIGFVISLFSLLLKRVSAKIKVPIILTATIFYAVFAGFSASVVRACIMSGVGLMTLINGQRSDLLNNLSLAFTFIITTSPFTLFDAGFLMSFSAVFGIACFAGTFRKLLCKIKFPRFLAAAIAVSTAAQIGIAPCLLYFFHNLPLYSVIANIILIPLITVAFMLLLIVSAICLCISNGVLLVLPQSLLIIMDASARFISSLPLSKITLFVNAAIFLLFPLYFVMSKFVMLPRRKWMLNLSTLLFCGAAIAVSPISFGINEAVIPIRSFSEVTSIVRVADQTILIGDCRNGKQIERTLNSRYLAKIDAVYLTSLNGSTAQALIYLRDKGICSKIYCPKLSDMGGIFELTDSDVNIEVFDATDDISIVHATYDNKMNFIGYNMRMDNGKKILFLGSRTDYSSLSKDLFDDVGIIRCRIHTSDLSGRIFLTGFSLEDAAPSDDRIFCTKEIGEYIFDFKNGEVLV